MTMRTYAGGDTFTEIIPDPDRVTIRITPYVDDTDSIQVSYSEAAVDDIVSVLVNWLADRREART